MNVNKNVGGSRKYFFILFFILMYTYVPVIINEKMRLGQIADAEGHTGGKRAEHGYQLFCKPPLHGDED